MPSFLDLPDGGFEHRVDQSLPSAHRLALQPCGLLRVSRFTAVCAVHGPFPIDEYETSPRCPQSVSERSR